MSPTSLFNSIEVTLWTIYSSRYMDYTHKNIVLYHIYRYIYIWFFNPNGIIQYTAVNTLRLIWREDIQKKMHYRELKTWDQKWNKNSGLEISVWKAAWDRCRTRSYHWFGNSSRQATCKECVFRRKNSQSKTYNHQSLEKGGKIRKKPWVKGKN